MLAYPFAIQLGQIFAISRRKNFLLRERRRTLCSDIEREFHPTSWSFLATPQICCWRCVQEPIMLERGLSRVSATPFASQPPTLMPQTGFNSTNPLGKASIAAVITRSEALRSWTSLGIIVCAPRALRHERIPPLRNDLMKQLPN